MGWLPWMPSRALAAVALAALLAGCASSHKPAASGGPTPDFGTLGLQATATTGVIRGVVVDNAIRPLGNATVKLTPGAQAGHTDATGAFGFDNLAPGTYFLAVTKTGFLPAQQSVDVVAGVKEPPVAKVQLLPDASFRQPYYEQFTFDGFIECSAGAGAVVSYAYLSACSASAAGQKPFPNDHFASSVALSGYPTWVQAEMTWESTQAVSKSLSHSFYYDDPNDPSEPDGEKDLSVNGPSPLVNTMDNATAKEYIEGLHYQPGQNLTLNQRIFTVADGGEYGPGPAMTVEQKFTIYTTVFYGYKPADDWRFSNGDPVPPPA